MRGEAGLAQPVQGERLVDAAGARAGEDQPEPELPVGRPEDRLVEAAVLEQAFAPHGGEAEDEVALQDRAALVGDLEPPAAVVVAPDAPPVDDEVGVGREDVEVGSRLRELAQRLERRREVDVVGVEDRDEVAARRAPRPRSWPTPRRRSPSAGARSRRGRARALARARRWSRRRRRSPRAGGASAAGPSRARRRSRPRPGTRRRSRRRSGPARRPTSARAGPGISRARPILGL